jgi:hypothetical protein
MTQRVAENFSTVDWSLGTTMPPRDPNDDDDDDDDMMMITKTRTTTPNSDDECERAVVREPDEDD